MANPPTQDKIREVNGVTVNIDQLIRDSEFNELLMANLLEVATGVHPKEAKRIAGVAFRNRGLQTPHLQAEKNRKVNKVILSIVAVLMVTLLAINAFTGVSASKINELSSSVTVSDISKYLHGLDIDADSVELVFDANERYIVKVGFYLESMLTVSSGRLTMQLDSLETFEAFQPIHRVKEVQIVWLADFISVYGNESADVALTVFMTKSTIDLCNFDNLTQNSLSSVADWYVLHPAFIN